MRQGDKRVIFIYVHIRWIMRKSALSIIAILSLHGAANAQIRQIPDPSAIVVPDLSGSSDPSVISEGWKYFLFQRDGVSFEEAYKDFTDCSHFLGSNNLNTIHSDRFVPWNRPVGKRYIYSPSPYGLVGALVGQMFEGALMRRDYQAKMRRCMETRGYIRYGVSAPIWNSIYNLPVEKWVSVQAKIASNPNFGGKVPVK